MSIRRRLQRAAEVLYETVDLGARRKRLRGSERGQAMLEYVVTTLLAVLGLIGVGTLMHAAIGRYLLEIYYITAMPVP